LNEMEQRQAEDKLKREKENLDYEANGNDPEKLRRFKLGNERGRLFSLIKDEEEKKRLKASALENQYQTDLNAASQVDGKQTDEEVAKQNFKIEAIKSKFARDKQNLDAESNNAVAALKNEVAKTENEIKFGAKKDDKTKPASPFRGGYTAELTDNQKIGAFINGPQVSLLTIQTQALSTLRSINRKLGSSRGGKLGGMSTGQ